MYESDQRQESYRDRLLAKICDIFHSMFYCVQGVHDQSANICIQGYLII